MLCHEENYTYTQSIWIATYKFQTKNDIIGRWDNRLILNFLFFKTHQRYFYKLTCWQLDMHKENI